MGGFQRTFGEQNGNRIVWSEQRTFYVAIDNSHSCSMNVYIKPFSPNEKQDRLFCADCPKLFTDMALKHIRSM